MSRLAARCQFAAVSPGQLGGDGEADADAFAILGLRALYLLLAGLLPRFTYLKLALAVILAFVGLKMLLSSWCTFRWRYRSGSSPPAWPSRSGPAS